MSFSSEVKESIVKSRYKNSCCRRAVLQGIIFSKASVTEDGSISFNLDGNENIEFAKSIIKEFFGKDAQVLSLEKGGRGKRIVFDSKALRSQLLDDDMEKELYKAKCPICTSAFLRGVFFASGRVSDPDKQFCLEFSLRNQRNVIANYFEALGFEFKLTERRKEFILYSKNSSVIEDFFASADLNDVTYALMNIKIKNEFLNNANRLRNFDTVNISKAVDAASEQYELLVKLEENNLISRLPEELIETARLRLANPDMSLAQLARSSVPPISKSGITHRIQKIMKLGRELVAKYDI